MPTFAENKVVVSAAVEPEQRAELERLARDGERTLSQQVRIAVREHLERTSVPPGPARRPLELGEAAAIEPDNPKETT